MTAANPRVLVVDDDAALRSVMEQVLVMDGFHVATAGNGVEGLQTLGEFRPDLILLDLLMPVLDGAGFRRQQLAHPDWAGIPTIIITAAGHLLQSTADLAPAAVLYKPFDLDELLLTVTRHLA